jgi:hypothetical protein
MPVIRWLDKVWRRNKRTRDAIEAVVAPMLAEAFAGQIRDAVGRHGGDSLPAEVKDSITAEVMGLINKALKAGK